MSDLEFNRLSWCLLEMKVLYYVFPEYSDLPDSEYDRLEKLYLEACEDDQRTNTVQSMVGVDESRSSVQAALTKLRSNGYKTLYYKVKE